jgi:hypothetical protein
MEIGIHCFEPKHGGGGRKSLRYWVVTLVGIAHGLGPFRMGIIVRSGEPPPL